MTNSNPNVRYLSEEESDLYEHEMYVIEVWGEYIPDPLTPDFFRGYRTDEHIRDMLELPIDEDLNKYEFDRLIYILKTPILSKCELYKNEWSATEECVRIDKLGIPARIRKVDVRLKDD